MCLSVSYTRLLNSQKHIFIYIFQWGSKEIKKLFIKTIVVKKNFYLNFLEWFRGYGETCHFKGSHVSISAAVKKKLYHGVSSENLFIQNGKQYADYSNEAFKIFVTYLDDVTTREI